jgi:glycine/D-amino acid oxidase-like deaminating enzyme
MGAHTCDVAVIGGGVIGCAVAYYTAKQGASVIVIEREAVGVGASSANAGSINMSTKRERATLALGMASQRLYESLSEELGCDVEYTVVGKLIVAEREAEVAFLEELATAQRAAGAPVEIVSSGRCRELNPLLEGTVLAGLYCPTDAQANPFRVTQAYARAAQNCGVRFLTKAEVNAIDLEGTRVRAVSTTQGRVRAKWVVNAAGAYAARIGSMVGVRHEVMPKRGQLVVLEAAEALPTLGVSGATMLLSKHGVAGTAAHDPLNLAFYYSSRPRSGTVLLGSTNELAGFDTRVTPGALARICDCALRVMPRLERSSVLRSWAGLRPYSASGPLLGRVTGLEGYAVATGHGGDGMALAPITGAYVSALIARDGGRYELDQFLNGFDPHEVH